MTRWDEICKQLDVHPRMHSDCVTEYCLFAKGPSVECPVWIFENVPAIPETVTIQEQP